MDLFNPKELGKKSTIDDGYWRNAFGLNQRFLVALRNNDNQTLMQMLRNPRLFRGKS